MLLCLRYCLAYDRGNGCLLTRCNSRYSGLESLPLENVSVAMVVCFEGQKFKPLSAFERIQATNTSQELEHLHKAHWVADDGKG